MILGGRSEHFLRQLVPTAKLILSHLCHLPGLVSVIGYGARCVGYFFFTFSLVFFCGFPRRTIDSPFVAVLCSFRSVIRDCLRCYAVPFPSRYLPSFSFHSGCHCRPDYHVALVISLGFLVMYPVTRPSVFRVYYLSSGMIPALPFLLAHGGWFIPPLIPFPRPSFCRDHSLFTYLSFGL